MVESAQCRGVKRMGTLKSNGDVIERNWSDRIHGIFPSYERFWLDYIGNDGFARSLPMPGADKGARKSRKKYWQRVYTILESVASCWEIENDLAEIEEIKSVKIYHRNINLWMAFYAHVGRIHDMVKGISKDLHRQDILKPFEDYWKERHIVLHGPKPPMQFVYNALTLPALGEQPRKWNDKMLWSELGQADFDFLAKGISSILRGLEQRLERCFAELYKVLPCENDWRKVVWQGENEPEFRTNISNSGGVEIYGSGNGVNSGTLNISGSAMPSEDWE
jgi:hypothetical protein